MAQNLGKVRPGSTIEIGFNTFDSNDPSASVTLSGLAVGDIEIYKDGSMTQRASTSGYTLLDTDGIDLDGTTGVHGISIDLSDNATAGFYEAGSRYSVVIGPITVDGATINFIAGTFRIGYDNAIIDTTIDTLASQTSFTLPAGIGPGDDDALNGCPVLVHDIASAVQMCVGYVSDYVGSTRTITLEADPGIFTMAAGDNISIFMPSNNTKIPDTLSLANINAEVDTALSDYDGPTLAELQSELAALNDPTAAAVADAVWDELMSGHTTSGSFAAGLKEAIYVDGAVWLNPDAANTNTVDFVDGTPLNPVSTPAAAQTLLDSLGLSRVRVIGDGVVTLTTGDLTSDVEIVGSTHVWEIDLNNASTNDLVIKGARVDGGSGNLGLNTTFEDCYFDTSVTLGGFIAHRCAFGSGVTITLGASQYTLHHCYTDTDPDPVNGPVFNATGSTGGSIRLWDWHGPCDFTHGSGTAWDIAISGSGLMIINSGPASDTVYVYGNGIKIENSGSAVVEFHGDVWDQPTSGRAESGTFGEQVSTDIDAILADTNELQSDDVPGLIAALNDLSAAEVNTEVDTALSDIHLDHLFAANYDPASKPGVATALLNELIEDDGGISRFTANALEQAPTGGSAPTAEAIADAVWDELMSGHTTSGSFAVGLKESIYQDSAIWIDTGAANTNTTDFVDGTPTNPVSTWAAAATLLSSLGFNRVRVIGGSSLSLTAGVSDMEIIGENVVRTFIDLNDQTLTDVVIRNLTINGGSTNITVRTLETYDCHFNVSVAMDGWIAYRCSFENSVTITLQSATYYLVDCFSRGSIALPVTFEWGSAVSGTNFYMYNWKGVAEHDNVGDSGTDELYISGESANVTINASSGGGNAYVAEGAHVDNLGSTTVNRIHDADDFPAIADAIWEEPISGHTTGGSYGVALKEAIYQDGAVWCDSGASNTNTVDYVDGTPTNPVSTLAAAVTLADSLGLSKIRLAPSTSTYTATSSISEKLIYHEGLPHENGFPWVDLNSQTITRCSFEGVEFRGSAGTTPGCSFTNCYFPISITVTGGVFDNCGFKATTTLTFGAAGFLSFVNCWSRGDTTDAGFLLDYGTNTEQNVVFWNWQGHLRVQGMDTSSGNDTLQISGKGRLELVDGVSGTEIEVYGNDLKVENSGSGTVTYHGDVWDIPTSGHAESGTFGEQASTDIDAILADTNELQSDDVPGLIAALNDLSAAAVNAEILDVLDTDTFAEPTGVPGATVTLATKIGYLYMALRNRIDVTATKKTFFDDADNAEWEKDLSDNGTTYSESEGNSV